MTTRSKTNTKRENLKSVLRQRCLNGDFPVGRPLTGVRDLANEFDLSRDVVASSLKELEAEGLIYTMPRLGTFIGRPVASSAVSPSAVFLMVYGPYPLQGSPAQLVKMGFEDRLGELGAVAVVLETETALDLQRQGKLPSISGVLDYSFFRGESSSWLDGTQTPNLPRVGFGSWPLVHPFTDFVALDDVKGGRQATQHLLARGHKRIAFLAFHAANSSLVSQWSKDRQFGWRQAMEKAGHRCDNLSFCADSEVIVEDKRGLVEVMRSPVRRLLENPEITAVVAANDAVAHCLLDGLQHSPIQADSWPAIVGFDGSPDLSAQLLTSLRMPWAEVGRAAADLLWSRSHAQQQRKPQLRRFPMRMVTRLSCRPKWSGEAGEATLSIARPA